MKVLLFTGAGTSTELGVPAMRAMAEQFVAYLHDIELERLIIDQIERLIENAGNDMEHAIDLIDKVESGFLAQRQLGQAVDETQIIPYRTLREEAEWFVQHSCEQIKTEAAIQMWSPTIRAATDLTLTIVTTNYDRAIEITSSRLRLPFQDGFELFAGKETAAWKGFNSTTGGTRLLKLHGSTDWYHGQNYDVFKLRHPMPLYGPLEIVSKHAVNLPLHSALVLPSREKKVTLPPFPELSAEFRNRAVDADIVIFVGSSLRDPHIRDVCANCARDKPTFVVSRSGAFDGDVLPEGAAVIKQSSGQFLISSFPLFLKSEDPSELRKWAASNAPAVSNVLEWVVTACGTSSTYERCAAIENLAISTIALPATEIELLLGSSDKDVSLYALGLIQASPDREALLGIAKLLDEQKANAEFSAELKMLEQLAAG